MPIFKSLVWLDPEKSHRKQDLNPRSSAPEADALTTRPGRWCKCRRACIISHKWLTEWYFSSYPVRFLVWWGQCREWWAWFQRTVTGWDSKVGLQLLAQCCHMSNSVSRSVHVIHFICTWNVKQARNKLTIVLAATATTDTDITLFLLKHFNGELPTLHKDLPHELPTLH